MSSTSENPYSLTFTPITLVASRFNASGSIELAKTSLGPEYHEFYQNAVQHFDQPTNDQQISDRSKAELMFRTAVEPLTEQLSKRLGHAPEYAALFFPSVFSFATRQAAVAGVLGDHRDRPMKDGRTSQATCQGYGLLQGKNLGRDPGQFNDEGALNLVIVLEYEKDFLYAWLLEVAFGLGVCPADQDQFCKGCSEQSRQVGVDRPLIMCINDLPY